MKTALISSILTLFVSLVVCNTPDSNGYIMYCPCMGRFGNQADHFLGALGFAKGLNRTLILPPWIEYQSYSAKTTFPPFDTYFKVETLLQFHRVITMERFMSELAPTVWPPGKRTVFCYGGRENTDSGCSAKSGNPFQPFWDSFKIDFDKNEFYSPLHYDIYHSDTALQWSKRYPADTYPVLAFSGAPASFPVQKDNRHLHRYLVWSDSVKQKADEFVRKFLPKGPFIGIHLRNGADWTKVCDHVNQSTHLFSSPQCLGYGNEYGSLSDEMCFPSSTTIEKELIDAIHTQKAVAVFVASDHDHMIKQLSKTLNKLKVEVVNYEPPNPHVDLCILGRSNHLIANCISSFSAFAVRERQVHGLPYSFWAVSQNRKQHEEL